MTTNHHNRRSARRAVSALALAWVCTAGGGGLAVPATAQDGAPHRGLTPDEAKLAQRVGLALVAVQEEERAVAAQLGLTALGDDLTALQRTVEQLQGATAVALPVPGGAELGGPPGPVGGVDDGPAAGTPQGRLPVPGEEEDPAVRKYQRELAAQLKDLAAHCQRAAAKVPSLPSPRQKRVAQRALAAFAALERDVRAAAAAPPAKRAARLAAVAPRLRVERFGLARPLEPGEMPTPTVQTEHAPGPVPVRTK